MSGRRNSKTSRSASAIVADEARGRHELSVDASSLAVAAPTGAAGLLSSCPFTVGGHRWRIRYYPNGDGAESVGHVSIYLSLDEDVPEPVRVQYRLSIVAQRRALGFIKRTKTVESRESGLRDFTSRCRWGYSKVAAREDLLKLVRPRKAADPLPFTIRLDVVVFNGFRAEEAAPKASAIPPSDLQRHLGDLLQSRRGADVVFEVGGETFAAHRCVLAARSPVISAELLGAATDSSAAVRVDGVEPRAFGALLRYAYTDALPDMDKEEEDATLRSLLAAADRYGLLRLKLICEDKLCKWIDVGTVETMLALSEKHHCGRLNDACLKFLSAPANLRAVMGARGQ